MEESAEHKPESRVDLCSLSFYNYYYNSPFDKLNIGKCLGFLPSP